MEPAAIEAASRHPVVFGVYRDGDNNLDDVQERNVTDFIAETDHNAALKVVAEDTTALARPPFVSGDLRTESSIIQDGAQHIVRITRPADMSARKTLAAFVERTLSEKASDSKFARAPVWIDLVDHGGGDGGGLEADSSGGFMSMEDIAGAIADGRASFRAKHPDCDDAITGVLANQCLMATLGFASSLSASGVKYLCASPETMLAPGVPSAKVADDLTKGHANWPQSIVDDTMHARYGYEGYHPAAAFDVIDLDPVKIASARNAIEAFNKTVEAIPRGGADAAILHDVRTDIASVKGMARFDHSASMPWHADRPAIAVYERIADDGRLSDDVRTAAAHAARCVQALVLAHSESKNFGPFHASYADAVGPTVHVPATRRSYDAWADAGVTETHNDFFDAVDGRGLARAVGSYNAKEDRAGDLV